MELFIGKVKILDHEIYEIYDCMTNNGKYYEVYFEEEYPGSVYNYVRIRKLNISKEEYVELTFEICPSIIIEVEIPDGARVTLKDSGLEEEAKEYISTLKQMFALHEEDHPLEDMIGSIDKDKFIHSTLALNNYAEFINRSYNDLTKTPFRIKNYGKKCIN